MPSNVVLPRVVAAGVTQSGALVAGRHTVVSAAAGALTMTLPALAPANAGATLSVEKIDTSTNTVTITGSIRGANASLVLSLERQSIELVADATGSWYPVAGHVPLSILDSRFEANGLSDASRTAIAMAAATPAKTLVIGPVRQYYPAGGPTSFPGQLRPYEPTRRFAIIRNHAPVTVMQIGIQTNPANSYNAPGSYPYSIPPGGSLVLANQTGAILARAQTSGQVWHCSTETHLAVI